MRSFLKPFAFLFYTLFIIFFCNEKVDCQDVISITSSKLSESIGKEIDFFIDSNNAYNNTNIIRCLNFKKGKVSVPIYSSLHSNLWARFTLKNLTNNSDLFISINYAYISNLWLYTLDKNDKLLLYKHTGNTTPFFTRPVDNVNFAFPIKIHVNETQTFYININSKHPLEIPLSVNNFESQSTNTYFQNFIIGIYLGIVISVFLYNFFIFISTKDKNYFLYVLYLFLLGFAQLTFGGWMFKYLWPNKPELNLYAIVITSSLAGTAGIAFGKSFLNCKEFTPKLNKILTISILLYFVAIIGVLFKQTYLGYAILNTNSFIGGILLLTASLIISKKGYKPAYFYFLAWSFFLLSVLVFVLRNLGIIPTNNFTHYILYFGSAIEAILLSIALADRINTLKRETIILQAEALDRAKENEQLVKDQNIILEQKVDQRTHELKETNLQLNDALDNLKDAQTQLVEAEKMASLGQLTAGIAHEINNPINFVKSNINPLRLDVRDLVDVLNEYEHLHNIKEETSYRKKLSDIEKFKDQIDVKFVQNEIDSLIVGIEEGAQRTAEIVQGLRTFSRIDESELKTVDIHDGILSTLVILKNSTPFYIEIEKHFNAKGNVECYPGKLNQVFMNIITNAIQAIKAKTERSEKEMIRIITRDIVNDCIQISVKDTGIGMSEETKHRVFEPFFTTKDVGEGTGLGMAIVFKIIQKHEGKIDILSKPFEGSEFIVTLPYIHPISDHP